METTHIAKPPAKVPSGQVEPPALPSTAGGDPPHQLTALAARLHELWDILGQTNQQMMSYLLRRDQAPPAPPPPDGPSLSERIEALGRKMDELALRGAIGAAPPPPALNEAHMAPFPLVAQKLDELERCFHELADANRAGFRDLAGRLATLPAAATVSAAGAAAASEPFKAVASTVAASSGVGWSRALLGAELAGQPQLDFQRQQLLDGVLEGHAAARWFVGLLLIFQAAPPEKLPPLLKDLGEAFYRWQPKSRAGAGPFETALVRALFERCQNAGINNTIELVSPGERYDATRHNATTRGVEISEVHGWVVLRDNGKVYTKANVAVK